MVIAWGAPIPSKCAFFPSVPAVETWPNMIVFRFPGTIGPYVITHSSNWWDGVTCLFSITVFFVCLFFFSSANIIGTWEKKILDLKVNMGSKSFSCYRISSGVCCCLGGGPGHSGRYQVSGNQNGGGVEVSVDSGFYLVSVPDAVVLWGSRMKSPVCNGRL